MSSSVLISNLDYQINPFIYNTVLNAVNLHLNGHHFEQMMLLPSLNSTTLDIAYEEIINDNNMTLKQISQKSNFRFFLFKMNNNIYSIITNLDMSVIYEVRG